jgi:large subunit ribosomal protein L15
MRLDEILRAAGRHRPRKRIGRGIGSGHGKTCGRGHKGAGSRAGAKRRFGFEGGQNPMLLRIPQRGFSNVRFRAAYQIVNVAALERFESGTRVDAAALRGARLIRDADRPVKVLGHGELTRKLTVVAAKVSARAAEKIAAAGGSVESA